MAISFQLFDEDPLISSMQIKIDCEKPGLAAPVHGVHLVAMDVLPDFLLAELAATELPVAVVPPSVSLPIGRAHEDVVERPVSQIARRRREGSDLFRGIQPRRQTTSIIPI